MKSPTPESCCEEGVFQIQYHISDVNFSSNTSISQVSVNEWKTNLTLPLKPFKY